MSILLPVLMSAKLQQKASFFIFIFIFKEQRHEWRWLKKSSPVFTGGHLRIFQWQRDDLAKMLTTWEEAFDLDEWFHEAARLSLEEVAVVPDWHRWLKVRVIEQARKLGMPISEGKPERAADESNPLPVAWQCRECGQIHEGTQEQSRRHECLNGSVPS